MKNVSKRILAVALALAMAFSAMLSQTLFAYAAPESSVDFSELQRSYKKANSVLLSLDKKAALYSQASIQALIDVLSNEVIAEYLSAEDLSIYTQEDENAANEIAANIDSAYASIEKVSTGCDLSAYIAAAETINKLDSDVYSETKSLGSATRIANILVKTSALAYTDILDSENTSTVSCFKGTATQTNIDDATRTILDALYVSVKKYTVITSGAVVEASFQNGSSTGDTSPYTATYGSTVIAYSDIEDTAWYLSFSSDKTTRTNQFQGYGSSFKARVFGDINIYSETRSSETPNMIKIHRVYSNDSETSALQAVAFVDNSYVLPPAKACRNYDFRGYYVGYDTENLLSEGDEITVTKDTRIQAVYDFNGEANCAINATALENGTGFNGSVAYNTKIELEGGDGAYAWVETVDSALGEYRPFAIGSNISLRASESLTLTAVTEEEFEAFGFSLPAINMRREGTLSEGTKVIFNGQFVEASDKVREYGVVIGVSKNGNEIDADDLVVENAGTYEDYDIIRAKSTRRVGANQFSIGINGLAGKDFVYRGYLIYEKTNGEFITVYSS